MRLVLAAACLALVFLAAARGGEPGLGDGGLDNFFDAGAARRPVPGEWLEYRVAFPVDPLENSLRPDPALLSYVGSEPGVVDLGDGYEFFRPSFEPMAAWRVMPLRVEVGEVGDDGCIVLVTFLGGSYSFRWGMGGGGAEGGFYYDVEDGDGDGRATMKVGGEDIEVEVTRRFGDGYGFVRYFNGGVAFGVCRFATADVDLVLVGMGRGRAPAFPLGGVDAIEPPVGGLYVRP